MTDEEKLKTIIEYAVKSGWGFLDDREVYFERKTQSHWYRWTSEDEKPYYKKI